MLNYSGLPQRVRRIVKRYEYCISEVLEIENCVFNCALKEGYQASNGFPFVIMNTRDMETAIYMFKAVTKPCSRVTKTALYGFNCPMCGKMVAKGKDYTDLGGLNICKLCG